MRKIFKFQGVDCANCCMRLESRLAKIPGVNEVSLNFMNQKMVLDYEDEEAFEKVKIVLDNFSDGVKIIRIG